MPVAQNAALISNLRRDHVTLRQEIAAQTIGDLAGIDLVVLLLGRCNRPQHQWMSYHLLRMRKQFGMSDQVRVMLRGQVADIMIGSVFLFIMGFETPRTLNHVGFAILLFSFGYVACSRPYWREAMKNRLL
jgi:hypothetical protein